LLFEIASIQGLWPVLRRLPSWAIRRYFSEDRIVKLIHVDIFPRHESATFDLGEIASARVHMQVLNLTPFPVEIDRCTFYIRCKGVSIKCVDLNRVTVASGAFQSIFLSENISDSQANQIYRASEFNETSIDGVIEFNSKIRAFKKTLHSLARIQEKFQNLQHRASIAERKT
jgi:hypothetical protein